MVLNYNNKTQKLMVILAVLYHNFSKIITLQISYEDITSYGHNMGNKKFYILFLKHITRNNIILEIISKLIDYRIYIYHINAVNY